MGKKLIIKKNKTLITLNDEEGTQNQINEIAESLITEHNNDDNTHNDIRSELDQLKDSQLTVVNFKKDISSDGIYFYVEPPLTLTVEGNSITFFSSSYAEQFQDMSRGYWLEADSTVNIIVDWGDGSTDTLPSPATDSLTHTYTDGLTSHDITFKYNNLYVCPLAFSGCSIEKAYIPTDVHIGQNSFFQSNVKNAIIDGSMSPRAFQYCSQLESVEINNESHIIENFGNCENLTSVSISDTVDEMEDCFNNCNNITDYQLYWTGEDILHWDTNIMPVNENTIFTIPHGETQNYINKDYPEDALVERGE